MRNSEEVPIEKVYFGSQHGKSECDALGGVAKRVIKDAVKRDPSIVVADAKSFVTRSRELDRHGVRRTFLVEDVAPLDIPPHYSIKGTRSLHHTRVDTSAGPGELFILENSYFCEPCRLYATAVSEYLNI